MYCCIITLHSFLFLRRPPSCPTRDRQPDCPCHVGLPASAPAFTSASPPHLPNGNFSAVGEPKRWRHSQYVLSSPSKAQGRKYDRNKGKTCRVGRVWASTPTSVPTVACRYVAIRCPPLRNANGRQEQRLSEAFRTLLPAGKNKGNESF